MSSSLKRTSLLLQTPQSFRSIRHLGCLWKVSSPGWLDRNKLPSKREVASDASLHRPYFTTASHFHFSWIFCFKKYADSFGYNHYIVVYHFMITLDICGLSSNRNCCEIWLGHVSRSLTIRRNSMGLHLDFTLRGV